MIGLYQSRSRAVSAHTFRDNYNIATATTIRTIVDMAISRVFLVSTAELGQPSRGEARIALARQTAMYMAHVVCEQSMSDVGRLFRRDRTTVKHACAVIEDRRDDPKFNLTLDHLESIISRLRTLLAPDTRWRIVRRRNRHKTFQEYVAAVPTLAGAAMPRLEQRTHWTPVG